MRGHVSLPVVRFISLLSAVLLLALPGAGSAAPGGKKLEVVQHERVADELIVKFRPGTSDMVADEAIRKHGGGGHTAKRFKAPRKVSHAAIGRWWHVKLPRGRDAKQAIERLARDPNVETVEPNYVVRVVATPNDPRFPELWGMHNIGQTGGANDADIDATEAWDIHTGSASVIVAVIDTGVDYTHPDLAANMWTNPGEIAGNGIDDDGNGYVDDIYGYDFYNFDANPFDDHGHGTHCAGTIAGVGNNGIGVAGVSWNARIMALKFLGASGSGSTAGAIGAVLYATDKGARVMSNSWGGGGYSQALYDAIAAANDANALFVAAAGNSNSNNDGFPHYPSSYNVPNVLAVAATDHNDLRASFSSYGATSVDLGAPGVNILSSVPPTGASCCSDPSGYRLLSGTSMATPHVSGAAALLLAQDSSRTALGLKNLLMGTTDPVASLSGITVTGGRLNINNAISCSASQLALSIAAPGNNFTAFLNEPQALRATVNTCGSAVTGAQVSASFSSGETLALYDDGLHGDGAANDGTYGNTWIPAALGPVTLAVAANHPTLGSDVKTVSGTVSEHISYQITSAPFAWNDISNGTPIYLGDEGSVTIPIGFGFSFYGISYSNVTVSANGYLTFNGPPGFTAYNAAIPNVATPNNYIAPLWDDLYSSSSGTAYYRLDGVAPNRQLTVSWNNFTHWSYGGAVTFQAILRENFQDILFQYLDVVFGSTAVDNCASATIGVEDAAGTDGTQYSFNQATCANASALRVFQANGGNSPPVANPGGPYQGYVNQSITFNGSGSFDPEGSPLTYAWDFGDGTSGTGAQPTHVYTAKGTYTVTLIVNDGTLASAPVTTTVSIPNRAPVAVPGGPYSVFIGSAVAFNGAGSYDPDGDPITYQWNFDDGSTATGVSPSHVYTFPRTYNVTLVVNDGAVSSPVATTMATVINRAPLVDAGPDQTVRKVVGTVQLSGSGSDPDGFPLKWISWIQLSGPQMYLMNSSSFTPTFELAKNLKPVPTQLVFELRVCDQHDVISTDQVVVDITK